MPRARTRERDKHRVARVRTPSTLRRGGRTVEREGDCGQGTSRKWTRSDWLFAIFMAVGIALMVWASLVAAYE